jgi:phage FluMu gp28-like protein
VRWRGHDVPLIYIIRDPSWFWQIFGTYEDIPIRFDDWQVAHLHDGSKFRAVEKAPQLGFSWLCALEATWDALLHLDTTSGFVSVDQREASEKVLYAAKAYSGLPEQVQEWVPNPKRSTEELWFGEQDRPSRLMSIPATSALRGRRMSCYLDEADFYKDGGKDAHRVALGRVQRGGRVTMGSTCFGVDTQLDRTMQAGKNFSKARLPYTVAENDEVQAAIKIARDELDEVDFAEEYECVRGGGSDDFSVQLLRQATHDGGTIPVEGYHIKAPTVGAYDVGSGAGHPSILSIGENFGGEWRQVVLEEYRGKTLPEQEAALIGLLTRLPNLTLVIDSLGVGKQITQTLQARFPGRIIAMVVGPGGNDRGDLAIETKRAMQAGEFLLAPDREQTLQFKRTKLVKGSGRVLVEQRGSKKRTHYDKFWAACYLWHGIHDGGAQLESIYETRDLRVIDGGARGSLFDDHRRVWV